MERKSIKYIRTLVYRKMGENHEGFFAKNKDTLSGLVSLFTLLGIIYAALVTFFGYLYSIKAANFYQLERSFFNQENLGLVMRLTLTLILHTLWFFLPLLPFQITKMYDNDALDVSFTMDIMRKFVKLFLRVSFIGILGMIDYGISLSFFSIFAKEMMERLLAEWINTARLFLSGILSSCLLTLILSAIALDRSKVANLRGWCKELRKYLDNHWKAILAAWFIFTISISAFPPLSFLTKARINLNIQVFIQELLILRILGFLGIQYVLFKSAKEKRFGAVQWIALTVFVLSCVTLLISFTYTIRQNIKLLNPAEKHTYEIADKLYSSNLGGEEEKQKSSDSNIQVVILHHGSQVLVMNGSVVYEDNKVNEIDTVGETTNTRESIVEHPEDCVSPSKLVLDTSSYELQEASQYRFYRKTFNNVTTNAPENNNQ